MIFRRYSLYYDLFYKRKNYQKECDFLEDLFKRYAPRRPKTILDLGCGTGGHVLPLSHRGYDLTGIDASDHMLKIAKNKCQKLKTGAKFYQRKLQAFYLKKRFDVIICMFSVIDYLARKNEFKRTLLNIMRHMRRDSLFIFDFWNADAVVKFYKPEKKKIFSLNGKTVERHSHTKVFPSRRLCRVDYICTIKQDKNILDRFKEKHVVRYFALSEITRLLEEAGLTVLGMHPFLNINGVIRKNTWDVTCVCKRQNHFS